MSDQRTSDASGRANLITGKAITVTVDPTAAIVNREPVQPDLPAQPASDGTRPSRQAFAALLVAYLLLRDPPILHRQRLTRRVVVTGDLDVFDLLRLDGSPMLELPYAQRRDGLAVRRLYQV